MFGFVEHMQFVGGQGLGMDVADTKLPGDSIGCFALLSPVTMTKSRIPCLSVFRSCLNFPPGPHL